MVDAVTPYLTAILPTILVATLFYFLIRSIIEGDRRERLAQKRFEIEEDARRAAAGPAPSPPQDPGDGPSAASGNSRADS
ncbi:hypothetical protein [Oryzobacter terrae]|uniref:hypothetical protein n=1 Tax=Oryzobacter terrae TaxID=1620385 RepID=UPI00366B7C9A